MAVEDKPITTKGDRFEVLARSQSGDLEQECIDYANSSIFSSEVSLILAEPEPKGIE